MLPTVSEPPPREFSRIRLKLTFELSTPPRVRVAPYRLLSIAVEPTLSMPDLSAPRWTVEVDTGMEVEMQVDTDTDADGSQSLNSHFHHRRW